METRTRKKIKKWGKPAGYKWSGRLWGGMRLEEQGRGSRDVLDFDSITSQEPIS